MPLKPETRLRTKIIKYLRGLGGEWIVIHGGPYQAAGVSDIIGCFDGRFWAFEVKTPDKWRKPAYNLSELQMHFIRNIADAGGIAFCVCSLRQVQYLMESHAIYEPRDKIQSKLEEFV